MTTILYDGSSALVCTVCGKGTLIYRDHVRRICRLEGGETLWYQVPRYKCNNEGCRHLQRMLPEFIPPYKHYRTDIISGVLDGVITPADEDSFDRPSESTMIVWHHWLMANRLNIEGVLRSVAFRELGFSEEFLKSGDPLLPQLRSEYEDWLEKLIRYIYNSGNRLDPVY